MTKESSNAPQNERLMVSVRVRPVEPFRDTSRAVAVLDNHTLLFSEPPPLDRSDPEHHYRTGTLFYSGANNNLSNSSSNISGGGQTAPPNIGGSLNRNNNNSRGNLNSQQTQTPGNLTTSSTPTIRQQFTNNSNGNNSSVEMGKAYDFDCVFDENATQEEVYKNTAAPLVRSVLEGFCATVFAYGATGSGKTYTMIGTQSSPGIMARAVDDIFHLCANQKKDLKSEVYLSYLEVYNEQIRDLLRPSPGIHLDLREDKDQVHVAGLSEIRATTTHEVLNLLQKGNRARTMEATAANITSSRSHAVLQVTVRQVSRSGLITEGKLYLIDLAGSERASNTKNSGVRLREGGHINRSLLALGNCITALASGDNDKYINYRDSKLTRLLKAALGGPSKTAMIAHISPGVQQREETRNTLLYARRARAISNRVKKFTYQGQAADTNHVIQELRNEVKRLQMKLEQRGDVSPDSNSGGSDIPISPPYSHAPSNSSNNNSNSNMNNMNGGPLNIMPGGSLPLSVPISVPVPSPIPLPVSTSNTSSPKNRGGTASIRKHHSSPHHHPHLFIPSGSISPPISNSHSNNNPNSLSNSNNSTQTPPGNGNVNRSTVSIGSGSPVDDFLGKRDRPDLSGMKTDIHQLFDEEFRLRNDLLKLDGAMLQSALDCEILRLMVLDWETLKIQRDSDGEATTSEDSDHGKTEISSVLAELKQVRQEQDRLLQMRTNVENQLKGVRARISQTEEDATQYLPDVQREILSVLCKLQQEQVQKMSVEIEAELKRRGSLLLRCLRQKALGEAIIHRQRHFLNAIQGNPPKTGNSEVSSGSGHSSSPFLPSIMKPPASTSSNEQQRNAFRHSKSKSPSRRVESILRSGRHHLPPLSGIPKTTKYSEFRKSRLQQQRTRHSSSDDEVDHEPPKVNLRKNRANSPDLIRYKPPY